jgi:hypothetical protein
MSDTRRLIDFAHDQNGSEFRDALYSAIHDKVTAHIDAKRAEIAQTLVTQHEEVEELDEELYYQHAKKLMDQGRDSHKPGPGAPYGRTFDGDAYHNPPGKSRLHVMDNGKKVKTVHVPDEHIERMDTKGKLEWPNHMDPTIEKHHFDAYAKTNAKHISDPVKESVESKLDEATSVVGKPEHLGGDEKGQSLGAASASVDGVATHHIHNGQKFKVESDVDRDGDVHHTVLDHKGKVVHYHMVTNDGWGKNERVGNKPSPDHAKLIRDHVRAAKPHLTAMADHIFPGKHQQEEGFPGPDYKSQVPTKPGEKAGFTYKEIPTGKVYSRVPPKPPKDEPTEEK